MQQFIEEKFAKTKGTSRAGSGLAQTLQTLAVAPTRLSSTMAASSMPAPPATYVDQALPAQRIEPQRLSIGTGFAGAIWPVWLANQRRIGHLHSYPRIFEESDHAKHEVWLSTAWSTEDGNIIWFGAWRLPWLRLWRDVGGR